MNKTTALSVGAGSEQVYAMTIAKKLGLRIIACDQNADAPGNQYCDMFYPIDIKDEDAIVSLAKKENVQLVLPSPIGRYITTVGAVNDALNLKGISKTSALSCADKYLFHQKLSGYVSLAKQFLIHSEKDLHTLMDQHKISSPFILKPRFGSGSKGVQVFTGFKPQEIHRYFKNVSNIKDQNILLESLLPGKEIGIDGIIRNGLLEIIAIRDKELTPLPFRQALSYSLPSMFTYQEQSLYTLLSTVCNKLSIQNTLFHADVLVDGDDIHLIEFSPRPSGHYISETLLPLALDFNPIEAYIQFLLGDSIPISKNIKPTYFEFLPPNTNNPLNPKHLFKIFHTLKKIKLNHTVKPITGTIKNGSDAMQAGYFILQGEKEKMQKEKKEIHTSLQNSIYSIDKQNQTGWEKEIIKNKILYPETYIVSFLAKNFPNKENNKNLHALDVGFGSGRHLKLLQDYGFNIYGIDYSQEACDIAKKLFNLDDRSIACDALRTTSFQGKKFDIIIAYGVAFLKPLSQMREDLKILYTALATGGKALINFRTKDDFLYAQGKQIDSNTYILHHPSYKDMCYTFLELNEAKTLLKDVGFVIENISRVDYHKNNLSEHHSWWIFEVTKTG